MPSKFVSIQTGPCPVCGVPLESHPECARCRIAVGEGHVETQTIDGVCSYCNEHGEKQDRILREYKQSVGKLVV